MPLLRRAPVRNVRNVSHVRNVSQVRDASTAAGTSEPLEGCAGADGSDAQVALNDKDCSGKGPMERI